MSETCVQCFISGRVQGVSFRAYTRKAALQLGLSGWARNLRDGRVEIRLCGDSGQVERLLSWLPTGVPAAQVSHLDHKTVPQEHFDGFDILPNA